MKLFGVLFALVVLLLLVYVYMGRRSQSTSASPDAATAPPETDSLWALLNGIYFFEGPGPRDRNNNPGNLKSKKLGLWPGQTGTDPKGFAIFPDISTGMDALKGRIKELADKHPDWDFYDLFSYYLTGSTTGPTSTSEGDSDRYAEFVADKVGVDPTTPVSVAIGGDS